MFLLSTDLPENDYVSQTITHRLYDGNVATKIAQFILLGVGGAKLMDEINFNPELYHLNEAHGHQCCILSVQKIWQPGRCKKAFGIYNTYTRRSR